MVETGTKQTILQATDVGVQVGNQWLVRQANLKVHAGEIHAILGANGAGKTTLLKCLSGTGKENMSKILFQGKPLRSWPTELLAKHRAFLSQQITVTMPFTAHEIIGMGRYPYGKAKPCNIDKLAITTVSASTQTEHLWHRNYLTLSGGERQRVQLARVLTQLMDPQNQDMHGKLLLLDEPITALDIKHQFQMMQCVREWAGAGLAVICILHDINIAMQYATHLHLMKKGRMLYQVPVQHAKGEMFSETFDIPVTLQQQHGKVMVNVSAA
jgi:iron complex transport system ATP-binding protein